VASTAVRRRRVAGASTIATMIAVVNAVVGSTAVALLVAHVRGGFDRGLGLPVGVGAAVGVILVGAFLLYQDRRYNSLAPIAPEEDV
jgi:hypothetical protein